MALPSHAAAATGRCCCCHRITRKQQQMHPHGHAAAAFGSCCCCRLASLLLLTSGHATAASDCSRQAMLLPPGAVAAAAGSCDSSNSHAHMPPVPICSFSMAVLRVPPEPATLLHGGRTLRIAVLILLVGTLPQPLCKVREVAEVRKFLKVRQAVVRIRFHGVL